MNSPRSVLNRLNRLGILGNNRRMRKFILPKNRRADYPLVDNKVATAEILSEHNISRPETLGVIKSVSQFNDLHEAMKDAKTFVIKPAKGSMGKGIMIVEGVEWHKEKRKTKVLTTRQNKISYEEFTYYLSMVLSGIFSLDGQPDSILIQEKITSHPDLENISYKGIADVRVILFYGFPAMSMIRLPSLESGGRGNLHQGAVGCGIDLKTGCITYATQSNRLIELHPDFPDTPLQGRVIPEWNRILQTAAHCAEVFPLTYMGVDIAIDPKLGPVVLEVNARPGLSIQIANQKGLRPALDLVEPKRNDQMSVDEKIKFAIENF